MLRRIILSALLLITGTPGYGAPTSITEITVTDQLGYACIDPAHLDEPDDGTAALAFRLAGKLRMPRTCLPNPCARALDRPALSQITGTPVSHPRFEREWEDYYARYADYCRKEVTPFGKNDPLLTRRGATPITPRTFWTPVLSPRLPVNDIITQLPPPPPLLTGPPSVPLLPPSSNPRLPGREKCDIPYIGAAYWTISRSTRTTACFAGGGSAAAAFSGMSPVPLPGALGLMMGALAAGALVTRRRSRKI